MHASQLRLSCLFTDGAVVQSGMPVPVWGWMRARSRIRVRLGDAAAQSLSGADGKFLVRLPSMNTGGPYQLIAESLDDGQSIRVEDVWVGEVWLASGQSNMQWKIRELTLTEPEERALALAGVRMINIPHGSLAGRQSEPAPTRWQEAKMDALREFSAMAYFFAAKIHAELGVKVGIVNASLGGTIIEAWTSRESLARNPDTSAWLASCDAETHAPEFWEPFKDADLSDPAIRCQIVAERAYTPDPANKGLEQGWASLGHDDFAWPVMSLPAPWTMRGHKHSGVFWFRKTVEIPASWAGQDLQLELGTIDKHDISYFNGEEIGRTGRGFETEHWVVPRCYTVPGRLVRPGPNVIAVRVYSFVNDGGLHGPANRMRIGPGEGITLAGDWRYQVEHDFGFIPLEALKIAAGPGWVNSPAVLFDNMIAPLVPYAIKGALWCQGEGNAESNGFSVGALAYRNALISLIRDWRFAWGQGDFPFLIAQSTAFRSPRDYQPESTWALLRDSQRQALSEPNTGLAVTIDAGDETEIHPKDKRTPGERLAAWALAETYGQSVLPSGPLYEKVSIERGRIRVHFRHAGKGLVAKGGPLQTFYLAGKDKAFRPAAATIDGDTVLVSSLEVPEPLAVRYAWADNPAKCNLYNSAGLPASPFRSDCWTS